MLFIVRNDSLEGFDQHIFSYGAQTRDFDLLDEFRFKGDGDGAILPRVDGCIMCIILWMMIDASFSELPVMIVFTYDGYIRRRKR